MKLYHQQLARGRWKQLSFVEQMANIGSEVERTINWQKKGNKDLSSHAFERALELTDLTIIGNIKSARLNELTRLREVLVDYFFGENLYKSTDKLWQKYFFAFTWAARKHA